MYGIVISEKDAVGMTSFPILLDLGFEKLEEGIYKKDDFLLVKKPEDVLYLEGLDDLAEKFDISYFAIISRHKAERGIKTLSVHPTGNFGEAKYGGNPRELGTTFANGMQRVFLELMSRSPEDYTVTLEVTHHGPTGFKTPIFFAEVGSGPDEWNDKKAVRALVMSILEGGKRKKKSEVAIGFGGGHYAPKFTPMEDTLAFSHICPKYNAENLDQEMIEQMIKKTSDGVDLAVIDEKGLKGHQRRLVKGWLENLGVDYQVI